jgi:RNA-splicing ligase RtcB
MTKSNYNVLKAENSVLVKAWTKGVPLEKEAEQQLMNVAKMPFIHSHIAVMPDVHWGLGATIGSVIPTLKAIIPAAVGVDIGCGMMAVRTSLKATDLPENLKERLFRMAERTVAAVGIEVPGRIFLMNRRKYGKAWRLGWIPLFQRTQK